VGREGSKVQATPSSRQNSNFTDLQIRGCELHKNAFGCLAPPGPAGIAIALPRSPSRYNGEGRGVGNFFSRVGVCLNFFYLSVYLNIYCMDSPDCLLLFLGISVFYFSFFLFLHFLDVGSVR